MLVVLACGFLAAPLAGEAQRPAKIPRIGFLDLGSPSGRQHFWQAFRQGLRDLGYVEGKNIATEVRWADGTVERLPGLAAELVRLKVDIIVAATTQAALAAKDATQTIPIILAVVSNPVESGLVRSLARPGGNVTGLSLLAPELSGKRLELLKEVLPSLPRVAVLWNPSNSSNPLLLRETEAAARALRVQLQPLEVRGPTEFDSAFSTMTRDRARALIVLPDGIFQNERRRIVALAAKSRLPAIYWVRDFVDAGGLMAYGPSITDTLRRAATYVDKILKGAKPADLPVEQPTKFELVINLKTAKALGLTIPRSVLTLADEVIQ